MPRSKTPFRAADDPIGLEEKPGADRVGEGRDQGRAALEAGERVLLDRQRVQPGAQSMRLSFPFGHARELIGEMRLPEGDVADPPDAEDHDQLGPLAFSSPIRSA